MAYPAQKLIPRPVPPPLRALEAPKAAWLQRIGIVNDYLHVPYANGSSYASQLLFRELGRRGHDVTVVGPRVKDADPGALPTNRVELTSLPLRNHPGVHLPVPTFSGLRNLSGKSLDLLLVQASTGVLEIGAWLRHRKRVPMVSVNTLHMPAVYNVILPDRVNQSPWVQGFLEKRLIPAVERSKASMYNAGDGLIVLSPGLKRYWEHYGVNVPIHVIARAVNRDVFDRDDGVDPFPAGAKKGGRLLVVCRHSREKGVSELLEIFASKLLPAQPELTLTIIGDGPDHETFRNEAKGLGVEGSTFFLGEQPIESMARWYRAADAFVYTSLSETYGQVVSEALWCGLPVVALADDMGVSGQVANDADGFLIEPGRADTHDRFAEAVLSLVRLDGLREQMKSEAVRRARERCDVDRCIARYYNAFESAREHAQQGKFESALTSSLRLGRCMTLHGLAALLGLLRPPATLNRNRAKTGDWEALPAS